MIFSVGGIGEHQPLSEPPMSDAAIRKIFPHAFVETRIPIEGSALARIKQRRRELAAQLADSLDEGDAAR
jgi:hypothetical protein